ncbi:MAG: class I SAM-dependent methyltransferase [Gemmataceae bacterium]|nr:class I SAM-dependent methyltransferase [Gemmataceae bacterium]MDW8265024.1 class I SAM-dependent methyltransferase [Gemmataceae bacterium]
MEGSYPGRLRLWDGWAATRTRADLEGAAVHGLNGPHNPRDFAHRLYVSESLVPSGWRRALTAEAEPYTLQWFLDIENQRHGRQARWIPRLLEFSRHPGERLLGLGNGLGTDWLQYARHGAAVVVCSPSADQLALIRRNFELRGLTGRFYHAPADSLPLENASIDVACIDGLLQDTAQPEAIVAEVYRVLKPGGKVLAVTRALRDIDYWLQTLFPWKRWFRSAQQPPRPLVSFTGRSLRRLFGQFVDHRIYKRHLRRSDVPPLWRWLPLPWLERLGGRVLVLKAFKPLSAALALQAAA